MERNNNVRNLDEDGVFIREVVCNRQPQAENRIAPDVPIVPANVNIENLDLEDIVFNHQNFLVGPEGIIRLLSNVHTDYNLRMFQKSSNPLRIPVIMSCIGEHMDLESMKNFRLSCKLLKNIVDPFFYEKGTFCIKNSAEFYHFIKRPNTENYLILQRMKKLIFTNNIDLFEVSRIMYRGRNNLKEVSVLTTPLKLRGEFQNIAGVLPTMLRLRTLRLNLPRRYLLHQLFRANAPLSTIDTIGFNFENAQPQTISGVFSTCTGLQYVEITENQSKHLEKLSVANVELSPCSDKKVPTGMHLYKVFPKIGIK